MPGRLLGSFVLVIALLIGCGGSASNVRADRRSDSDQSDSSDTAPTTTTAELSTTSSTFATSTTLAAPASLCEQTALAVSDPTPLVVADPVGLATSNALAPLPAPGLADRAVSGVRQYQTAQDYIADATIKDPQARLAVMNRDGFRGGAHVSFTSGQDSYAVIMIRFATPESAIDYVHAHLRDACGGLAASMTPIPGLAGVVFRRTDVNVARGVFVAGDTEVNLEICTCVEVTDRLALARDWAQAIAQQLASG